MGVRHPARWLAALLVVGAFAPRLLAEQPSNADVDQRIDQITEPPEYDWLRAPREPAAAGDGDAARRPAGQGGGARRPPRRAPQNDGCAYEPQPQGGGPPPRGGDRPAGGEGCSGGPAPGSGGGGGGGAAPADASGGCGDDSPGAGCGDQSIGDCGCDRSLGDCGCARPVGGCGCAGLGQAGAALGYVIAFLALALIVFFVVRAIIRRESRSDDGEIVDVSAVAGPEQVRVSQVSAIAPATMMDRAIQAAAEGDYRSAVGWAYLAGISALHRQGFTELDQSTTNLRIVESTRRRGGPHRPAARLVRVFEELFFGGREPLYEHWRECRAIVEQELGPQTAHQS